MVIVNRTLNAAPHVYDGEIAFQQMFFSGVVGGD